jgi:hypothetical protein
MILIEPLEPRALFSVGALPARRPHSLTAIAKARFSTTMNYPTGAGPATVNVGADGKLVYTYDTNGDHIMDFSECGYRSGGVAIPDVPVKVTLTPIAGDNSPQIQAAIDAVGNMPLDANGFRGAVLLKAGVYEFTTTINLNKSGVVLRGEGSGPTGTILRRTVSGGDAITITGSGSRTKISGTTHNVVDNYAPVGANYLTLDSVSGLNVGDSIIIHRPDTEAWRTITGQLDHFQPGDADLDWDRVITAINGTTITFDAPITEALDQQWGGGTVYKYTWSTRLTNCGVEDIRADATVDIDDLNNTGGAFMSLSSTANCWVRRCYNDRMRGHSMLVSSSKWDTIEDIVSYHNPLPAGHSGASTQIFAGSFSELILWHRIIAYSGGFEFSGGRQNSGPMAWVECQVPKGFAFSGPHQQWNMGYLWDSLDMTHNLTCIEQHDGEAGGNHVAWNCESTATYNFETVPTVHQWIQGCIGDPIPPPNANGPPEILSYGTHLQPGSLYRAQLYERVGEQKGLQALGKPDAANWLDVTGATTLTLSPGQNASSKITFTPAVAYTGQAVSFSATGLPAGGSASFSTSTLTAAGGTTLNLNLPANTPLGTYYIKVTGTGTFPLYSGGTQSVSRSTFITVNVTGAPPTTYEAENLAVSGSSGDPQLTLSEPGLSGGKGVEVDADAVGDFIRFMLPNVQAGNYDVLIGVKNYRQRGIVQTKAGDAGGALFNIGTPIDLYSSTTQYAEIDLGNWTTATAGNKSFEFGVVGKNASSFGYVMVIDYIKLVPV